MIRFIAGSDLYHFLRIFGDAYFWKSSYEPTPQAIKSAPFGAPWKSRNLSNFKEFQEILIWGLQIKARNYEPTPQAIKPAPFGALWKSRNLSNFKEFQKILIWGLQIKARMRLSKNRS